VDPVKTTHGMSHGWTSAEQLASGEEPEFSETDEFSEESCEATIVRLDSTALEALCQKARA
jgi:hypothetical protein